MSSYTFRRFKDKMAYVLGFLCVLIAIIPLGSILFEVVRNGFPALNFEFFTGLLGPIGQPGGGIANSIQGTLILIALTSIIGVPVGIMSGIYLAEYGDNRFGSTVRFFIDVFLGFPSIVIGIFAYLVIVLTMRNFSAIAGAFSLSIIMLPIVAKTTEEAIRLVPNSIREASMALGVRRWRTIVSVVLSTAKSGIATGVILAVARIAGETAPLIMTILGSQWFFAGFDGPMDALPLRIWRMSLLPYDYARQQGWGAALILILIVLTLNIAVRFLTRRKYRISM